MESKKVKVTVDHKTFNVVNGTIEISMFDTQKRIDAVKKFARENAYSVRYVH